MKKIMGLVPYFPYPCTVSALCFVRSLNKQIANYHRSFKKCTDSIFGATEFQTVIYEEKSFVTNIGCSGLICRQGWNKIYFVSPFCHSARLHSVQSTHILPSITLAIMLMKFCHPENETASSSKISGQRTILHYVKIKEPIT